MTACSVGSRGSRRDWWIRRPMNRVVHAHIKDHAGKSGSRRSYLSRRRIAPQCEISGTLQPRRNQTHTARTSQRASVAQHQRRAGHQCLAAKGATHRWAAAAKKVREAFPNCAPGCPLASTKYGVRSTAFGVESGRRGCRKCLASSSRCAAARPAVGHRSASSHATAAFGLPAAVALDGKALRTRHRPPPSVASQARLTKMAASLRNRLFHGLNLPRHRKTPSWWWRPLPIHAANKKIHKKIIDKQSAPVRMGRVGRLVRLFRIGQEYWLRSFSHLL